MKIEWRKTHYVDPYSFQIGIGSGLLIFVVMQLIFQAGVECGHTDIQANQVEKK